MFTMEMRCCVRTIHCDVIQGCDVTYYEQIIMSFITSSGHYFSSTYTHLSKYQNHHIHLAPHSSPPFTVRANYLHIYALLPLRGMIWRVMIQTLVSPLVVWWWQHLVIFTKERLNLMPPLQTVMVTGHV